MHILIFLFIHQCNIFKSLILQCRSLYAIIHFLQLLFNWLVFSMFWDTVSLPEKKGFLMVHFCV